MVDEEFIEGLRSALNYNPETGKFIWKVATSGNIKVGSPAGCANNRGRLRIRFKNKSYLAYRLAWLISYNKWPEAVVDHIDGNPLNNALINLRDVSQSVNMQNQRKANSNNQTGFFGASLHKKSGKYRARIRVNGKDTCLGYFLTPEEAHTAYLAAKRKFHEGCVI